MISALVTIQLSGSQRLAVYNITHYNQTEALSNTDNQYQFYMISVIYFRYSELTVYYSLFTMTFSNLFVTCVSGSHSRNNSCHWLLAGQIVPNPWCEIFDRAAATLFQYHWVSNYRSYALVYNTILGFTSACHYTGQNFIFSSSHYWHLTLKTLLSDPV